MRRCRAGPFSGPFVFGTSDLLHLFYLHVSEYPKVGDIEVYQSNQERNDAYGYEILGPYRYGRKCLYSAILPNRYVASTFMRPYLGV